MIFEIKLSLTRAKDSSWNSEKDLDPDAIEALTSSLQDCRLFFTADGIIGIAPNETREGDMLCILRGSRSPSILRGKRLEEEEEEENGWTLVSGDCHVHAELSLVGTDDEEYFTKYVDAHGDQEEEFLIW